MMKSVRDAIDLVAATVDALGGVVEHAIFGEDLVDGRTPTRGVVFTEDSTLFKATDFTSRLFLCGCLSGGVLIFSVSMAHFNKA